MHRRTFLKTASLVPALAGWRTPAAAAATNVRHRLGCTSVCFRARFASTRPKEVRPAGPDLTLLEFPRLCVERLGLTQVELWSRHFAEATPAYAARVREAATAAGARIVNLQLDEPPFDLSSPDAGKRRACLDATKRWMEIAAACGSPSLRANTGGRKDEPFDLAVTAESFRQLAEHGARLGLKVLVENHGGHSLKAENVAAIVQAVNSPWCRSLPDFGNVPAGLTLEQRLAFLRPLLPTADLISAKGMEFDSAYRHLTYDLGACVRAAEAAGFAGVYSIELWSTSYLPPDPVRAVQTVADTILSNLKA